MVYLFTLYIAGQTTRSQKAIYYLQDICESILAHNYEIVIVDILENPEAAEKAKILATPTLILDSPLPKRRIVGDLSDRQQVLISLNLYDNFGTDTHGLD